MHASQHTVAEDTLGWYSCDLDNMKLLIVPIDSEDLIFPRTATRVGQKFQANIPPAPDFGSAGYGGKVRDMPYFEIYSPGNVQRMKREVGTIQ